MSRLRTQRPASSAPEASAPQPKPGKPPSAEAKQRSTTKMLVVGWLAVMVVLYAVTELYRSPAEGKVIANGVLEIPRDRDGHFRVSGAINGVPVHFMVDTGASIISITDKVADRAQMPEGIPMTFQTANGVREGTMRRADRVEVGPLVVNNLRVGTGYTAESEKDALLGQNFLRYFDVSMNGDTMRLTARP